MANILHESTVLRAREDDHKDARAEVVYAMATLGDLGAFIEYVLGMPPAPHHYIWFEALQNPSIRELNITCPPGHGKTVTVELMIPWDIALDNNLTCAYISHKDQEARKTSYLVRSTIAGEGEYGERFKKLLTAKGSVYQPTAPAGKWAEGFWSVERSEFQKDPTFQCSGDKFGVLGARLKRIYLDDVNDPENVATPELRADLNSRLKSVVLSRQWRNTVRGRERVPEDRGRVIDIRTRWAEDDSLSALMEHYPDMTIIHMPSIGYWELILAQVLGEDPLDIYPNWTNNYIPPQLTRDFLENCLIAIKDYKKAQKIPSDYIWPRFAATQSGTFPDSDNPGGWSLSGLTSFLAKAVKPNPFCLNILPGIMGALSARTS